MTPHAGAKLGPYEITAPLGAGGMGEVYRARDTKLNREVAIKILPDGFAHDAERIARFTREAHVLASLNHPHIAQIHGLEDADGISALVMELVEGPTLADRIALGPMPMDEALAIVKQIAEALEAAHEQGIIHRDLKPANIKVREDGTVKVLDFGLAKALDPAAGGVEAAALTQSPTITSPAAMTQRGVILGTAAYMAPEQAKGRAVDKRADIWAFGCVLYEMLTGTRAFPGEDVSETLASVLKTDPDWATLPAETPFLILRLLRHCLTKDHRQRLADIRDARLEIEEALTTTGTEVMPAVEVFRRRPARIAWSVAGASIIAVAALTIPAGRYLRQAAIDAPEMRLEVNTPPTDDPASMAISPDGRRLVFSATTESKTQLWVRPLDSVSALPLAGTDGAVRPFWSPDSQSIGFFADGKLKRIDVSGGPARTLADAPVRQGGAWNSDGVVLFERGLDIVRVAATGGAPVLVIRSDNRRQYSYRSPQFLPDNRHFTYFAEGSSADNRGVYLASLDAPEGRRLLDADTAAVYAPSGALLFARQGTLMAQRFDPDRLMLVGDAIPLAEQVAFDPSTYRAAVSVATTGAVVYRAGAGSSRQLVWVDRSGKTIGMVGSVDRALPRNPELSPDGTRIAVGRSVAGNSDIWLIETARGVSTRLTSGAFSESSPVWSPDGQRVAFISAPKGPLDLYQMLASGAGVQELLLASPQNKRPQDWSPDGRFLLYWSNDPKTGFDLWALPLAGDRQPFPVVKTEFNERDGQFSPDGRWIAYESNESLRYEVYVQPFPGPGRKWPISTLGGVQPRWRRDGKELFYLALDGTLMAAPVILAPGGQALEAGTPVALFPTHLADGTTPTGNKQQYAVAADGQRFLLNVETAEATAAPITVVLNWTAGLKP